MQDGGTDWRTIRVLDVNTGKVLVDEVKWVRFTNIAWVKDGSGFFYARFPEPKQGTASQASVENHAVYVPMFIVRRKDVTDPAPTLLYAYGGWTITEPPAFTPERLAWIEQGGVFAIAHIRGGSEYGKAWHDAGRRQNKQNVFDDFIAAGEYLKA